MLATSYILLSCEMIRKSGRERVREQEKEVRGWKGEGCEIEKEKDGRKREGERDRRGWKGARKGVREKEREREERV